jgi:hypothetical protein
MQVAMQNMDAWINRELACLMHAPCKYAKEEWIYGLITSCKQPAIPKKGNKS